MLFDYQDIIKRDITGDEFQIYAYEPETNVESAKYRDKVVKDSDINIVLFPLIFAEMLGKVDIEANVEGGGPSGQAGAIRWGIAMSLRSFVDQEMVESMRLAGLLQRDYRRRERKKYGQEGARRKYTWKKR
ncbi:28S ribosomal protein S9, mitochondrial-like [Bactrocera tryoni]|uniref:28S ribosomal protein S9, mitochondrial-like n=1 Tax=Bactrocera tryoni TaxID=59916 RepID=UPI001A96CF1E|nr:28S ribosomal protein S9, mitochondrial-like [Bactrocera tryoni]